MTLPPVSDAELHAYLDGELSGERRRAVERLIADDPALDARLQAYRAQQRLLHDAFDPVLDEPVPARLLAAAARENPLAGQPGVPAGPARPARPARTMRPLWRSAAAVALVIIGGLIGWTVRGHYPVPVVANPVERLPRQAALAHAVFSPDVRRPVEVTAEHEDQLVTWLSRRLGTPVKPPKLGPQGFDLVGGRLLPGDSGPVAQFMYQDASGQRLTLYVTHDMPDGRQTAFRFAQQGALNVFYWVDGRFGYALSAGIGRDTLARIATAVYDQLDRRPAGGN
ncbi:MAG: anti-sigma factor [Lautropia sp.]